jgi:calnexin
MNARVVISLMAMLPMLCRSSVFFEDFEGKHLEQTWGYPSDSKYSKFSPSSIFKEARKKRDKNVELKATMKNSYYGLTAPLDEPLHPSKGIVVQFDTTATEGHSCGGRYIKLLTHDEAFRPQDLSNSTPFSILFGPDKCDPEGQIRLIINHLDPVAGLVEKHWTPRVPMKVDTLPHVYTLVVRPSNSYVEIMEDGEIVAEGSLFENLQPPINPPEMIPDPDDIKPLDWVDEEWIVDPTAKQPDDWVTASMIVDTQARKPAGWLDDEPRLIPKKGAKKPKQWRDEEDGEWKPPMIPNPKCELVGCGRWKRPMSPNPAFRGKWEPPKIRNPR